MSDQITLTKIFQKTITLGNVIQIFVIVVGGVVGYNKLEWRITQLEQVKIETRQLIEQRTYEVKTSTEELGRSVAKLNEAVARLVVLEEVRQKNAK